MNSYSHIGLPLGGSVGRADASQFMNSHSLARARAEAEDESRGVRAAGRDDIAETPAVSAVDLGLGLAQRCCEALSLLRPVFFRELQCYGTTLLCQRITAAQ
jgi:hypothetical protein